MPKKTVHGNSNKSEDDRHLYVFYDHEERTIYKFGISKERIREEDDTCSRMRIQLGLFNSVANTLRYTVRILLRFLPGKTGGEAAEDDAIEKYQKKHGHLPRGNRKHRFPSRKRK